VNEVNKVDCPGPVRQLFTTLDILYMCKPEVATQSHPLPPSLPGEPTSVQPNSVKPVSGGLEPGVVAATSPQEPLPGNPVKQPTTVAANCSC